MPELEQKAYPKRLVAYKVRVADILNANFTRDELSAGYIRLNGIDVSRVNIIATLVYKSEGSYASAVIDDNTGKISLRSFENNNIFSNADIGDVVLVIGRIREFNGEKYIAVDILKKIENAWVNVRQMELKSKSTASESAEILEKAPEKNAFDVHEDFCSLVRSIDSGNGASIDEVIKKSGNADAEAIINKLLADGSIFEIKPGKLKVLE